MVNPHFSIWRNVPLRREVVHILLKGLTCWGTLVDCNIHQQLAQGEDSRCWSVSTGRGSGFIVKSLNAWRKVFDWIPDWRPWILLLVLKKYGSIAIWAYSDLSYGFVAIVTRPASFGRNLPTAVRTYKLNRCSPPKFCFLTITPMAVSTLQSMISLMNEPSFRTVKLACNTLTFTSLKLFPLGSFFTCDRVG